MLDVKYTAGPDGKIFPYILVRGTLTSRTKEVMWAGAIFEQTFRPVGRRIRFRSFWQRLGSV